MLRTVLFVLLTLYATLTSANGGSKVCFERDPLKQTPPPTAWSYLRGSQGGFLLGNYTAYEDALAHAKSVGACVRFYGANIQSFNWFRGTGTYPHITTSWTPMKGFSVWLKNHTDEPDIT